MGSAETDDLVIKRPKVSRAHARVDYDGHRWTISDQDSVTGMMVNQTAVKRAGLNDGDLIGIGAAVIRFESIAGHATPTSVNGNGTKTEEPQSEPVESEILDKDAEEVSTHADEIGVDVDNAGPTDYDNEMARAIPALVEIQPGGSRRPLFVVAAGHSDVELYANLAAHLGEEQPLYVLQVPRLATVAQPTDAIEFLAAHYIDTIREIQEQGPYQICGYNIGGIVAYEMAQQILCVGDSVSALILIDTPYPLGAPLPTLGYRNAQTLNQLNQQLLSPLSLLGGSGIVQQMAAPLSVLGKKLGAMRPAQMQRMDSDYATFVAALSDRGFETNLTLTRSYKPDIYPNHAVLILAEDSPVRYSPTLWDWSSKIPNGLETRLTAGSFASILRDPDVRRLATQVSSCLEGGNEID